MTVLNIRGFLVHKAFLSGEEQAALVADLRAVAEAAPVFAPETARGSKMSVRMTSAGEVGWVSDRRGYRYEPRHPAGNVWPQIPARLIEIWERLSGAVRHPDTCLINYYGEGARMGLHQDRDESDLTLPVLSVSLGDDALFRMGNVDRGGATESIWLQSGDVVIMGGAARLRHHGIDRLRFGSSSLLPQGGRLNATLRVAR